MSLRHMAISSFGRGLEPETIIFNNRVVNDGGEVIDLKYANSEVKRLKQMGMWSKIWAYPSVEFAIKRSAIDSTKIEKVYCLKRALMDLIQTNATYQGTLFTTPNGKLSVSLDGVDDYYQSGIDTAMIQPLTNWFNFYKVSQTTSGYYYDGMNGFDNCRIGGAALIAYAGTQLLAPASVAVNNYGRLRTTFNGASSVYNINGNNTTGNTGTNSMNGITIGKPGGSFATGSSFNQMIKFHSILVMQGTSSSGENTSTDTVYSSRYI